MSHVHPKTWGQWILSEDEFRPVEDCPDCLAREKAQEELVAEFVRQEERIEKWKAQDVVLRQMWREEHAQRVAREEEVKRLREALEQIEQHATNRYWELPAEPWAADLSVVASIAREALSSLEKTDG